MTPLRYGSNEQLEVHRLLIEALACQGKWGEAKTELDAFATRLGREPLHRKTAETALHNIGLVLALQALLFAASQLSEVPTDLFTHMMSLPCFVSIMQTPQASNVAKFCVLNLVLALTQHSPAHISRYREEVLAAKVNDASLADNQGWLRLADLALRMAT
jgi:hypothetical protein